MRRMTGERQGEKGGGECRRARLGGIRRDKGEPATAIATAAATAIATTTAAATTTTTTTTIT